jgi:hypothetical protein
LCGGLGVQILGVAVAVAQQAGAQTAQAVHVLSDAVERLAVVEALERDAEPGRERIQQVTVELVDGVAVGSGVGVDEPDDGAARDDRRHDIGLRPHQPDQFGVHPAVVHRVTEQQRLALADQLALDEPGVDDARGAVADVDH